MELLLTARTTPGRRRRRARRREAPDVPLLARCVPGLRAGQIYGYRAHGPSIPSGACASTRRRCCSIPTARPWRCRRATTGARPRGRRTTAPFCDQERRCRPASRDWGRRRPAAASVFSHRHLRAARGRHAPPELGLPAQTRDLQGADRQDPLSSGPGHHRGGSSRVPSSTRRVRPAGARTTGATRRSPFSRPTRPTARARDRFGPLDEFRDMVRRCIAPGSRSSSTWRSTIRPRRSPGPDAVLPRNKENAASHIPAEPVALRRLQRHRQHLQRESADRAPAHRRQPALLGRMHARGRLASTSPRSSRDEKGRPLENPRARAVGYRKDPIRCSPARSWSPGSWRRRRPLSKARLVRRRQLEEVERPLPGRRAQLHEGRPRDREAPGAAPARRPDLYSPESASGAEHQLRNLPRQLHAERSRVVRSQSTQRANSEGNRDGNDFNLSWNCGVEGPATTSRSSACATAR